MIKKNTLIVLACAAILGGVLYFLHWKSVKAEKSLADTYKLALGVKAEEVSSVVMTHPAKADQPPVRLAKQDGKWRITQPVDTATDSTAAQGVVDDITSARITQTEPSTPDRLKAYGLDPPHASVEVQLSSGTKHTMLIGDKVFDASSVYAIIDGAKNVSVLPDSVLTSADKSSDDLRDHTVLRITTDQVASFTLKNPSGDLEAHKEKNQWEFTKPGTSRADRDLITSLFEAIANAKLSSVASEKPDDLAKYGLTSPAVTFTAVDAKGQKSTLLIGKKDGTDYFARDASRPMIFHVGADLDTQLTKTYGDLRDKKLFQFELGDINRIEIHNTHGTIVMNRKTDTEWTIDSPDNQKGKSGAYSKILYRILDLSADQFVDQPAAALTAKLAKPEIEVILTHDDGKTMTLKMSNDADVVDAQLGDSPTVYRLKKDAFNNLNLDPSDAVQ